MIKHAMILAAGKGTRMRAAPDDPPKPLTEIAGQSLLMRMVARLEASGIEKIVINLHHKAEQIERAMAGYSGASEIVFSDERDALLETGGGVKKALPLLNTGPLLEDAPFLVANGDILWREEEDANRALSNFIADFMRQFEARSEKEKMQALLMVTETARASGYDGHGDYQLLADGRLVRRTGDSAPYVFAGVQILTSALFETSPDGPFSLNAIYDRAGDQDALFGHVLDGQWMHVGTPEGRAAAAAFFTSR